MESTNFIGLRTLGFFSVCPESGQQTLVFHSHECLGYGDGQGAIHRVHLLLCSSFILEVRPWLFGGAFILVFLALSLLVLPSWMLGHPPC
ncbi:UNVERIFIED_CONTAM: hypothetical protein Sangu_1319000 [Sesamum angustifolium]|uniref:Uncharacterized protein n=1 Tax=Sesamum angustifolium TaxID=2727405 RepID=A0AAW2NPB2_9LAMI